MRQYCVRGRYLCIKELKRAAIGKRKEMQKYPGFILLYIVAARLISWLNRTGWQVDRWKSPCVHLSSQANTALERDGTMNSLGVACSLTCARASVCGGRSRDCIDSSLITAVLRCSINHSPHPQPEDVC